MPLRIVTSLSLLAACSSGATSRPPDPLPAPDPPEAPADHAAPPEVVPVALVPVPDPVPRGSLSAGARHVCATVAGRVACWGHGGEGQLGPSIDRDQPRPAFIDGLDGIAGVSAGARGSCAWGQRGAVWCWGTFARVRQAVARVEGIDDAVQVVVDDGLGCALRRDGRVACWATAACGDPTDHDPEPLACGVHEIRSIAGATELAIAGRHACARTASEVRCWHGNRGVPYALADSAGTTSIAAARQYHPPLQPGLNDRYLYGSGLNVFHNVYALAGNTVMAWTVRGASGTSQPTRLGSVGPGASRLAAGDGGICTIGSAVTCWPSFGAPRSHGLAAVDVAAGATVRCVRTAGDRIACWGAAGLIGDGSRDSVETPVEVTGIADAVQLEGGEDTVCVRRESGRVACWGRGFDGELDAVPADAGVDRAVELVMDPARACAIRGGGTTVCWGHEHATRSFHAIPPRDIPDLAGAVRLSTGSGTTCAIRADHRVVCHGALDRPTPLPERAVELWHAFDVACRRRLDRTVVCETIYPGAPSVELGPGVTDLAITSSAVCALRASGTVDCHGDHLQAPPRGISGLDDAVAIAAGGRRACVVRSGGTVACWDERARADGEPAPLEPVPGLTDAVDVVTGSSHGCALRRNRRVACWGDSDYLGDGSRGWRELPVLLPELARPRP